MMNYEKHLYMIVFPINALVASQLDPVMFAEHYTIGSARHYKGKVIFAEVDVDFRDPYFDIEHYLSLTVPHEDGSPKKTKFISSYAVLEHMDLKKLKDLYLVASNGRALRISSSVFRPITDAAIVRIFQEITPLPNLVASTMDQQSFGKYLTRETKSKGAPKIFFTQYEFNVETFLEQNKNQEMMYSPLPDCHPSLLYQYLLELKTTPGKKTKTINLGSTLLAASYALIRHGFWFAAGDDLLFYPMPTQDELKEKHFSWWKSV